MPKTTDSKSKKEHAEKERMDVDGVA